MQCGHFNSRSKNNTRYDFENLKVQCMPCNIWKNGNYGEFASRLIKEIGEKRFHALVKRGRTEKRFKPTDLISIIEKYKI